MEGSYYHRSPNLVSVSFFPREKLVIRDNGFENCHGLLGVSRVTFLEIVAGYTKLSTLPEFVTDYTIYGIGYFYEIVHDRKAGS